MTYRVATSLNDDDTPVEELNLSVHTYNCLKRSGIHTVQQIFALSRQELLAIRNFGRPEFEELRGRLIAKGFMGRGHLRGPFGSNNTTE